MLDPALDRAHEQIYPLHSMTAPTDFKSRSGGYPDSSNMVVVKPESKGKSGKHI